MAGIEHQRDGVGSARRHFGREVADGLAHVVLRQIGSGGNLEARIGEQFRHSLAVVLGVGQRRNGAVGRLADDQRNAVFGGCGVGERNWEKQ